MARPLHPAAPLRAGHANKKAFPFGKATHDRSPALGFPDFARARAIVAGEAGTEKPSAPPPYNRRMADEALRALAADGNVLAMAACTTALCQEAQRRHGAWPTAAAALGRVLTGAALLATPLKEGNSLTLRVVGDGPIGGLIADARFGGAVRGYARNPAVHLPLRPDGKLDVGAAVGRGVLHVTRDLGLGRPYTGSYPLVSGEIGDDLTAYLTHSEQVPSLVALGVLVGADGAVRSAGGLILQLLPGAPPDLADRLEAAVRRLGSVSEAVEAGAGADELLAAAVGELAPRVLVRQGLRFQCRCSRERVAAALVTLGPEELAAMVAEDGGAEAVCHFCGERYRFGREELEGLLAAARAGGGADPARPGTPDRS
jgi:molecular chaperone Hsp33